MAVTVGSRYVRHMTDPTSLPNFTPPPGDHPNRGRVLDALIAEGREPHIDDDGDVAFAVEGQPLFVRCMEGQLTIMQVFGQWKIGTDVPQDPLTRLMACNELTLRLNVVKVAIAGETLVVRGEHVVGPDTEVKELLAGTIDLVLSAVHMWHETVMGRSLDEVVAEGTQTELS